MSVLLPEKQARLDELFSAASEMTAPEKSKRNVKAVVSVEFRDGYLREFSLALTERAPVSDEVKQKKPGC